MTFINLVVILDGEEPWLAGGGGGGAAGWARSAATDVGVLEDINA